MPDPEAPREGNAPAVDPLLEILLAGVRGAVLRAGLELRVWARIAAGARGATDIAAAEGWDADGTRRLLDALCGMGFLGKDESGYRLVPIAENYLLPGKPSYMGDFILADLNWEGRGGLAAAIRTGRRPIAGSWTDERFAGVWSAWAAPHRVDPGRDLESFDAIWSLLGIEPRQGLRVLDLACGSALKTYIGGRDSEWPPRRRFSPPAALPSLNDQLRRDRLARAPCRRTKIARRCYC